MKNTKKLTLTIGIPAYNEGTNIKNLLRTLLKQKIVEAKLRSIIIVADGCTDNTVSEVKSVKNKTITLVVNEKRSGQTAGQAEIMRLMKSDYLVLLNGDIKIKDPHFIGKLIRPFSVNPKLGLVSPRVVPLPHKNRFEKVINYSVSFKKELFENINDNNVFLCHGRARAFSKKFAKSFIWPRVVNEDAYSFLECMKKGHDFYYQREAVVFYRSPQNLPDHLRQSRRFLLARHELEKFFSKRLISRYYTMPKKVLFRLMIKYVLISPILALQYLAVLCTSYIAGTFSGNMKVTFVPSVSSKNLK